MSSRLIRATTSLLLLVPALGAYACSDSCFGGATWISMRRGRKRLKDVQVGDVVQSYDVTAGQLVERPVVRLFRHERSRVGQLQSRVGTGPRSVTDNHPILLEPSGEFVPAGELDARHTKRRGLYWDDGDLRSIELEPFRAAPLGHLLEVYNLSIEGTETYFADGLLVHNKSDCDGPTCYPTGGAPSVGGSGGGLGIGGTIASGGMSSGGASSGGAVGSSGAAGSAGEGGIAGALGGNP